MKIFKTAGLLLFSSLFIFSCKTTSVQVTDAAAAEGAAAQTAQEGENSEKTLEYPVKKENEVWTDNSGKSEPFSKGLVTLRYKKKLGSFNIAVKNKAEKLIPVLSTVEEYTTSAFYLKSNNKIIKLFNDSNIKTGYSKSENAVRITYSVPDLADVVLEFLIFHSVEGGIEDMVEKRQLHHPKKLTNVIRCKNPRCITSIEQELPHIFFLADTKTKTYRCKYCEEKYSFK